VKPFLVFTPVITLILIVAVAFTVPGGGEHTGNSRGEVEAGEAGRQGGGGAAAAEMNLLMVSTLCLMRQYLQRCKVV